LCSTDSGRLYFHVFLKNEYRILKPIEIRIGRDEAIPDIMQINMEMS
jgi:hypothetical protein